MIDLLALQEKTVAQLKIDEGYSAKAYMDTTGNLTIGYGWNIAECPIRRPEADLRLANDTSEAIRDCVRNFPWFGELDLVRQSVLVNMCFNLGIGRLFQFEHTLAAIAAKDFDKASSEMLDSTWARQVGDRAKRLALQMRTGM